MAIRRNLAPNPALKNDASGWSGPSGWARSTSVGAQLPRPTGFEGAVAGDIVTPRAAVTAGQRYVWSISVRATSGTVVGELLVNYYAEVDGGSFIGNSGSTVEFTVPVGEAVRLAVGPYRVPSGARAGYLKINDIAGDAEVTAYQVEHEDTAAGYFDGDSMGASWDGTPGASSSTIREVADALRAFDGFTRTATAAGPVSADAVSMGEAFTLTATGIAAETVRLRDSFLIASLEYDDELGRFRVDAFTFAASVVRVRVSRRVLASGARWQVVRGGVVPVVDGFPLRPVDDYEYPAGEAVEYLVEGLASAEGQPDVVVQSARLSRAARVESVWLKFLPAPALNRRLTLVGWSPVRRDARATAFDVEGRSDPVVVSDVHGSRRVTITVKTETPDERDTLDAALAEGLPCFFQAPASVALPSLYASVGPYEWRTVGHRSLRAFFEIELVEVAPPTFAISGSFPTWQTILDDYRTWEQVSADELSWRGVVA
ncbi:hypothetical protein ACU61A_15695 [Pseudonocardia sichuanensis]